MDQTAWLAVVVGLAVAMFVIVRRGSIRARWRRLLLGPRQASGERRRRTWTMRRPGRMSVVLLAAAGLGLVGLLSGGPVAAGVAAAYGATGAVIARWWRTQRLEAASRRTAVDAVAGLAAELRAGLPVGAALAAANPALSPPQAVGAGATRVGRRVASAVAVAETSGAPLADVLDRLDGHLRAVDRARAAAEAQAAGTRASALMLAAMPGAGIGLGYAVGIDPFQVLLHTPLGASCLTGAVLLQLAGLAWAARLSRLEVST